MKKLLEEFKAFIMRGNILDMAIGVIIGGAFSNIVNSLLDNIISPILGCFSMNGVNGISIKIWNAQLRIGAFIMDVANFIVMAAVVFVMMKTVTSVIEMFKKQEAAAAPAPAPSTEEQLLMEIRDLLKAQNNPQLEAKVAEAVKIEKE